MTRHVLTSVLVACLLTTGFLSVLILAPGRASAQVVPLSPVMSATEAASLRYRPMTTQEVDMLKQAVGVRDPNRNYNVIFDGHGTGFAPPTEGEWDMMTMEAVVLDESSLPRGPLASSFDLSAYPTFPIVGNQGGQGSCAAWAGTYYDYGYQESADNGWTDASSGNPAHLMSAAWTYNKVNGGHDWGSWMGTNNYISRDWGTATLKTMPYQDWDPVSWGDVAAFREAPLHRSSAVYYMVPGPTSIDTVKQLVNQGVPVTFALDAGQFGPGLDGDYIISASEYNSNTLNHAQTVVGYDDSITDHGDVGAFRIVNSWSAGWGDGGFYWLTYAAFLKIGLMLNLTYTLDIPNYEPTLLAVWHFNQAPMRSSTISVGIGPRTSPLDEKTPYFEADGSNPLPAFMDIDVSEFKDEYDAGTSSFYLALGSSVGTVSSFKIELYEGGYTSGQATQASAQSWQVPRTTPADVTNSFPYYSKIPTSFALDVPSQVFTSTTWVTWVPVDHHSSKGGSSMQTGDIADSMSTDIQTVVWGPTMMWFDWKVSSELGADILRFSIDGAVQAEISGEVDWTTMFYSLTTGPHTLAWEYSKDAALSKGQDTGWIDGLMFDNAPPVTLVNLSGDQGFDNWFKGPVTVTLSASDNGIGVDHTEYRVDSGSWINYLNPFVVTGEGSHIIDYHSVDKGGNTEAVRQTTAMIDSVIPFTICDLNGTMGSAGWFVTEVNVSLTPTDVMSGVDFTSYTLDGVTWLTYNGTFKIDTDGIHNLEYYSQDIAGNPEPTHSLEVKVDRSAPVTLESESGTVGDNGWYTSMVTVNMSSSDSGSSVDSTMYRIGAGPWQVYSGTIPFAIDGIYSVQYYSQDVSGNKEPVQSASVKVDTTPPSLSFDQVTGAVYTTSSVTLSWSASDSTSGLDRFEASLDGSAPTIQGSGTSSIQLSGLSDGAHVMSVTAVDAAGLRSLESMTFTVDTKPPVTLAVASGTNGRGGWFVSKVGVSLTASDETVGVDSIKYKIDDGSWTTYAGSFQISQNGMHTIEYYSSDKAGNKETAKSINVLVDLVAPELNIISPSGNVTKSDLNASWFAADYESGLDRCEVSIDGADFVPVGVAMNASEHFADGHHVLVVRAYDVAGNMAERQMSFEVDTTSRNDSRATGGIPWIAYLAVIGLAAILVTLLAILLARRRRKEDDEPARRLPPPPPPLPPPPRD